MRKFKLLFSLMILLAVITASAQSPFLKSNGTATTSHLIADSIKMTNLSGTGSRLVTTDANGNLSFLPAGTSSQILYGNGLWGNLPTSLTEDDITINNTLTVPKIITNRITTTDSLIHFGDSSIIMQQNFSDAVTGTTVDRIFAGIIPTPPAVGPPYYKGLGIGRFSYPKGANSISFGGTDARSFAANSFALGSFVKTNDTANNSIVMGTGISSSDLLVNDLPNTMMIGFGSTKPTVTVFPTTAGHNTGSVLLGDDVIPPFDDDHVKLSVIGENDGITGFFYSASTSEQYNSIFTVHNSTSKAITVFYRDGSGIDHENFTVRGNGYVYARRVQVTTSASFPDYVFDKDYKFLSIPELKAYIEKNKKLPEYKSAKEVEKEGMDVGETARLNTQSIEQLTLYIISMNERLEKTEKENALTKKQNAEIKKQNEELKKRVTELELKK